MKVRIDESQGNRSAFDLVLIDGFENGEWPTNVQVEDSGEQISLARDLGCPFEDENDQPMPHPEGRHGIAYDFLSDHAKAQTVFTISEGHFDAIPYGPYKHCNVCGGFPRLGYGGDCTQSGQRFLWDSHNNKMVAADVAKRWAKIEVIVDYPCMLTSEEAFDDWLRTLDKVMTDKGVRPLYSTLKSVHTTDPSEGTGTDETLINR